MTFPLLLKHLNIYSIQRYQVSMVDIVSVGVASLASDCMACMNEVLKVEIKVTSYNGHTKIGDNSKRVQLFHSLTWECGSCGMC